MTRSIKVKPLTDQPSDPVLEAKLVKRAASKKRRAARTEMKKTREQIAQIGAETGMLPPEAQSLILNRGRVKGQPNKMSKTCKENIIAVFTKMGGTAEMCRWAKANRTDFYRMYSKLLPLEISGPDGGAVQLEVHERDVLRDQILEAAGKVATESGTGQLH